MVGLQLCFTLEIQLEWKYKLMQKLKYKECLKVCLIHEDLNILNRIFRCMNLSIKFLEATGTFCLSLMKFVERRV
jgi:hypothetical protein